MRSKKQYFILATLVCIVFTGFSQKSPYNNQELFFKKIEELYSKGNYNTAFKMVDTLNLENSFFTCVDRNYLVGAIFKYRFKVTKSTADYDSSVYYFAKSLSCSKEFDNNVAANLKYMANACHNSAADALTKGQIDSAEFFYFKSRKAIELIDPSQLTKRDVEFYLACGSSCHEKYDHNRELNKSYLEKGLTYNKKVLELDSNNFHASYNTMIFYYNEAIVHLQKAEYCKQVDIANTVEWANPKKPVPSIEKMLECIKPEEYEKYNFTPALKKALPYALTAYRTSPKNKNVLQVLMGISNAIGDKKSLAKYKNEFNKI